MGVKLMNPNSYFNRGLSTLFVLLTKKYAVLEYSNYPLILCVNTLKQRFFALLWYFTKFSTQ